MAPTPHQATQDSPAYPDLPARNTEPVEDRLARMQGALGLADEAVPARLRQELARACAACGSRTRCTRWLLFGGADDEHREFCPNAARYDGLLRALGGPGRRTSKRLERDNRAPVLEHTPANWSLPAGFVFSALVWAALVWAYWSA